MRLPASFVTVLAALVSFTAVVVEGSTATSWSQVGGDALHSGANLAESTLDRCNVKTLQIKWQVPIGRGSGGQAAPVVANERVYLGSGSGALTALDLLTGSTVWTRSFAGPLSTPSIEDGRIFVVSAENSTRGLVHTVRETDGQELWASSANGNGYQSAVSGGSLVYVGTEKLRAFDPATGSKRWEYGSDTGVTHEAAVVNGKAIVASNGTLAAISANGDELWTNRPRWGDYGARLRISASSTLAYAGSFGGYLGAFDTGNGTLRWQAIPGGEVFAPAIADGRVFAHTSWNRVHAYDGPTGEPRWIYDTAAGQSPGGTSSNFPPTWANNILFVSSGLVGPDGQSKDNRLLALDPRTGDLLWQTALGKERATQPTVVAGMVLIQTENRTIAFAPVPGPGGSPESPIDPTRPFRAFIPLVVQAGCTA